MLGAISMMHSGTLRDFELAGDALSVLIERHPREALPRAWYACWHSIQIAKGLSGDPKLDGMRADDHARRAMDLDPENSLAISVAGLICTNVRKKFDEAERLFEEAVAINPSDSHAFLFRGALHMFTDRGPSAYALCRKARAISPCDPRLYYIEAITASAAFTAENYEVALEHAAEAKRRNGFYTPALRVRTASLALLGRVEEARHAAHELLQLEPSLTVGSWRSRTPSAGFLNGDRLAAGLLLAGVPE